MKLELKKINLKDTISQHLKDFLPFLGSDQNNCIVWNHLRGHIDRNLLEITDTVPLMAETTAIF